MSARAQHKRQQVRFTCDRCGRKLSGQISHYQIAACPCGHRSWALQPQRDGPFVMYPHPGFSAFCFLLSAFFP